MYNSIDTIDVFLIERLSKHDLATRMIIAETTRFEGC